MKKCYLVGMLSLSTLFVSMPAVAQEVIANCGASKGKMVYLTPQPKWEDDGITNGSIMFIKMKNGKFDVIVKDAVSTLSYTEDGASIVGLEESPFKKTFVVLHSKIVVEVFQLTLKSDKSGTLIWSSLKNGAMNGVITKGALFTASCSPIR